MSSGPPSLAESIRRAGARLSPRAEGVARRLGLGASVEGAVRRLARTPRPEMDGSATDADIFAAYRLLLGREPDPGGLAGYRQQLGQLGRDRLAAEILSSPEFARQHRGLVAPGVIEEAVEVEGFSVTVDPSDWAVGATIAAVHRYEPEVTAVVRSLLAPGGSFVDVGANIGWFSLLAASIVGSAGSVLAVEPNLRNCDLLGMSRTNNGFQQIDVVAGAVSDREGWLALETDASNGRVIRLGPVSGHTEAVRCSYAVPAFTLDRLLTDRNLDRVDAIKVDVEGVETAVFAGAERLLSQRRPPVVFEWYPEALRSTGGVDPTAPLRALRDHGYSIAVIGHPSADPGSSGPGLSDHEIEALRAAAERPNLDLLARPPH